MRKIALLLALAPGLALAQIGGSASFRVDLPVVLPRLVVVQPGIQVVPDVDAEVFFADGFYWVRGDDHGWYKSRSHRGGWVLVEPRRVPPGLARMPPGQYKRWHGPAPAAFRGGGPGHGFKAKDGGFKEGGGPRFKGKDDFKGEKHGKGHGKHRD